MPEVFTALLCKGTSSKYANRLCVSNLNGDFMKYAPTDGEEKKKKKEGGSVIQLFSLLLRQGLYENLPATHPQPLPLSQRSKSIFYYCRIQPSSSISSVLSYQWMSTDHRRLWLKSGKMGIFNNAKPSSSEEVYVNMATLKSLATC